MKVNNSFLIVGSIIVSLSVVVVIAVVAIIFVKYEGRKLLPTPTPTPTPTTPTPTPNSGGGGGYWIAGSTFGNVYVNSRPEGGSTWDSVFIGNGQVNSIVPLLGGTQFLVLLAVPSDKGEQRYDSCLNLVTLMAGNNKEVTVTQIDLTALLSPRLNNFTPSTQFTGESYQEYVCTVGSDGSNVYGITNFGKIIFKPISKITSTNDGWSKTKVILEKGTYSGYGGQYYESFEALTNGDSDPCVFASFGRYDASSSCFVASSAAWKVPNDNEVNGSWNQPSFISPINGTAIPKDGWKPTGFVNENPNGEMMTGATYTRSQFAVCGNRGDIYFSSPAVQSGSTAVSTLGAGGRNSGNSTWPHLDKDAGTYVYSGMAYNNIEDNVLIAIFGGSIQLLEEADGKTHGSNDKTTDVVVAPDGQTFASIASDGKIFGTVTKTGLFFMSDATSGHKTWKGGETITIAPNEKITVLKHSSNVY